MIADYVIVKRGTSSELELAVRDLVSRGWQPAGGVQCAALGAGFQLWLQALTHHEQGHPR